jgi:hypothetical protein
MASAPMITPKKLSQRQWNERLSQEHKKARETIQPILASSLSVHYSNQWVPVLDLFDESAMHGMAARDIFKSLWKGATCVGGQGTQAYMFEKNILLRHKFSNCWWVLGRRKDRKLGDMLADYIDEAMLKSNHPSTGNTTISQQILDRVLVTVTPVVSAALLSLSQLVNLKQAASTLAVVTPGSARTTRLEQLTVTVQHAPKPLDALMSLTVKQREGVMQKLTAGYKKADVYEDVVCVAQEEGNAVALLKLFKGGS